jgi:hypothetical protein
MARRSPPRKVTYFEPVPPRLARNTIIESTFEVGRRFRCTMRVDCGQLDPDAVMVMAHAEVRVQNNAIDAIVATAQQILIESAQPVRHGRQVTGTLPQLQTAPQGPLFRSPVCEKA